jgi:hypothetical protein
VGGAELIIKLYPVAYGLARQVSKGQVVNAQANVASSIVAAVDNKNVTRYNFDDVHANNDKKLKDKREVRGIRDE